MGQPKLLLPWKGSTILDHLVAVWTELGIDQWTVVTAGPDSPVGRALDHRRFPPENRIINPRPDEGMFSSIQCAARWHGWNKEITHQIVSLGDQPHVKFRTLQMLIRFAKTHPDHIVQPAWNGRPKHPVVLPRAHFKNLARSDAPNLKIYLDGCNSRRMNWPSDDAGLALDLDYPSDYEKALAMVGDSAGRDRPLADH